MASSRLYRKKYFVNEDDEIFSVYSDFFDVINSREEALFIALNVMDGIYSALLEESDDNGSVFIGNMKVTTGLQRTLNELDKRWPFLILEARSVDRVIYGRRVNYC